MEIDLFLCPCCGNRTSYEVLHSAESWRAMEISSKEPEASERVTYFMVRCVSCSDISLWIKDYISVADPNAISDAYLCHPFERPVHDIPPRVLEPYNEARKVEKHSTTAYIGQMRRSLEAVCDHHAAAGRDLYQKITDLVTREIIPAQYGEIAHAMRTLGKHGAHATNYPVDDGDARMMKDLFLSLLEYLYLAPAKLARLKASIEQKSNREESGEP
jgi:hypothetical protein